MKPILSFKSVSKSFDGSTVLDNIDLDIESGHFYTLLGPSGCGKNNNLKVGCWI
ncbi:putative spermidine/putrescine import ATP-binding protein PotA [Staphylococcus gallinarum]|uniref:Putative spermidine/putrescine import ATP-binding protein PotA n=1 Tax=Staphylococcus gallinarum TaxID=1293 RepID=A0A380FH14_STAGA|nr:putative spermidine/putrescine import ATP-binding protein PotA [Staphylococcus gallinarum]